MGKLPYEQDTYFQFPLSKSFESPLKNLKIILKLLKNDYEKFNNFIIFINYICLIQYIIFDFGFKKIKKKEFD